jgi:group I intron endonuclease
MSNTAGVYCIQNNINGKMYIGQSHNIQSRFKHHHVQEHNKHLQRSFNTYGIENFTFRVLCGLDTAKFPTEKSLQDRLNDLEMAYIDILEAHLPTKGYNKTYGGEGVRCTEEVKQKLSVNMMGARNHRFGTTPSKETSRKRSLALLGRRNSTETIRKMSANRKDKCPIYCVNNNCTYSSIRECARILHLNSSHISSVCKNTQTNTKGYVFYYIKDIDINQQSISQRRKCLQERCLPKIYCSTNNTTYASITEASKILGVCKGNIHHVCQGHRKHAGGCVFAYCKDRYIWED